MNSIKIPENLKKFFYDYNHSKFLECNSEMAKMSFLLSNGTYRQNESQNKKIKPCFVNIAQELENMFVPYWLSSGTLLGKLFIKIKIKITLNNHRMVQRLWSCTSYC
jgi:hypothetical protein